MLYLVSHPKFGPALHETPSEAIRDYENFVEDFPKSFPQLYPKYSKRIFWGIVIVKENMSVKTPLDSLKKDSTTEKNTIFIASPHNDLSILLEEIESLINQVERLQKLLDEERASIVKYLRKPTTLSKSRMEYASDIEHGQHLLDIPDSENLP